MPDTTEEKTVPESTADKIPLNTAARARPLNTIFLTLMIIVITGYLLVAGKALIIPIITAFISVYVLVAAADWLGGLPLFRRIPSWGRRVFVLVAFLAVAVLLAAIVVNTAEQVMAAVPKYQENLMRMLHGVGEHFGFDHQAAWQRMEQSLVKGIDLRRVFSTALSEIGSLMGNLALVAVYMAFLIAERGGFARKLYVALHWESAAQTRQIISDVNERIGVYLAVKTLVNVILGVMSYAVLLVFGVDFALFWALIIALLNYIPYVGSFLGVIFPVLLTLAQFGSWQTTLIVGTLLIAAQFFVGNVLEPKMIGRQVNLSPFVVLVALSLWAGLWGIPGAILAIPLTAMIAIILGAFPATRPVAVLLSEDVDGFVLHDRRQRRKQQ